MKTKILGAVAAISIIGCTPAIAETVKDHYKTVTERVPYTEHVCNWVDVPIYGQKGGGASAGDVLGGMIIGGLIGKGVTNKDNGAAAGAVIGGMIAADKKKGNQQIVGYRQEQRCTTTYTNERVEEINGYKVYYSINGEQFHTHSNRYLAPGSMLTLRLKVTSVFAH